MDAQAVGVTVKSRPDMAQLVREGKKDAEIRSMLIMQYADGPAMEQLMQEVKKLRIARSTSIGLGFIMTGAFVLLISCMLAIMRYHSGSSLSFVLYGLTSTGILIVFIGLMKIFG